MGTDAAPGRSGRGSSGGKVTNPMAGDPGGIAQRDHEGTGSVDLITPVAEFTHPPRRSWLERNRAGLFDSRHPNRRPLGPSAPPLIRSMVVMGADRAPDCAVRPATTVHRSTDRKTVVGAHPWKSGPDVAVPVLAGRTRGRARAWVYPGRCRSRRAFAIGQQRHVLVDMDCLLDDPGRVAHQAISRAVAEERVTAGASRTIVHTSPASILAAAARPHFLFNALNAISSEIQADPVCARNMIEHLGSLLRLSLDTNDRQLVPLFEELSFLEHYLAIQRIRFGDRLRFEQVIDEDVRHVLVPSMVIQPLVENSTRHGLSQRATGGLVRVVAKRTMSNTFGSQ